MLQQPFYNPRKSYEENFADGPFGEFANNKVIDRGDRQPQHNFLGHQLYLPLGIPAGPLLNSNFIKAAFSKGFDICTYKTVRTRAHPCHQHPNILAVKIKQDLTLEKAKQPLVANNDYTQPLSITNSFGVPSAEPDSWQVDMKQASEYASKGQVLVGSFQGTRGKGETEQDLVEDYVLGARLTKEAGAKILEANLSCPNEGKAKLLCFDIPLVARLAQAMKNQVGNTPLLLKLAYFESDHELQQLVETAGKVVDGFVAINTISAQVVDKNGNQALPGEGRAISGVCGAGIKWAGLEMVKRLKRLRSQLNLNYAVVGVGGVMTTEDYQEYQQLGPDAVMSATGAMWNPNLAQEVWQMQNNIN